MVNAKAVVRRKRDGWFGLVHVWMDGIFSCGLQEAFLLVWQRNAWLENSSWMKDVKGEPVRASAFLIRQNQQQERLLKDSGSCFKKCVCVVWGFLDVSGGVGFLDWCRGTVGYPALIQSHDQAFIYKVVCRL